MADPLAEVSMVIGPDSRDKTLRVEYLVQHLENGGYDHEAGLLAHAPSCYFALTPFGLLHAVNPILNSI